jgi:hypothetical protein
MTENELLSHWSRARLHIVVSQLGPIFLLIVTVGLLSAGLGSASVATRLAAAGILLASGILGALVQYSSATEAKAIADDLRALGTIGPISAVSQSIVRSKVGTDVVRFITPAIFVLIYLAVLWSLFIAPLFAGSGFGYVGR